MKRAVVLITVCLAVGLAAAPRERVAAQEPCRPPMPPPSAAPNIFSEAQENDLGDAIAEQLDRDLRVIDEPEITGELRRIGQRLVRHLPATSLRIQFFLIDLPDANAFVLPGGRIYVSRKLVSFSQSEDELAAVLGHELGHLVLRQQTLSFTRLLREVLKVTSLGDRKDVFAKYHALMDNAARNPGAFRRSDSHEDREQVDADRLGLFVVAAAGYDPQAHGRLFDRLMETKGNTGGFFSNLFGTTPPEARRLREMLKTEKAIPASCVEPRPDTEGYTRWQAAVVSYTGLGRKESLRRVMSRTVLEPSLRGEVTRIRFSPDGRHILAQDDAGITVLSREPFAPRFRIEAPEATGAHFTPDSTQIVFPTADLRVERWSVKDGKLAEARELVTRSVCLQTSLSPDGRTMACLDDNFDVLLFEMATGVALFRKKQFYQPDPFTLLAKAMALAGRSSAEANFLEMGFSTDSRFFAASFRSRGMPEFGIGSDDDTLVYDFQAKAPVSINRNAKNLMKGGFVFTGPDRLVAFNAENSSRSAIIGLPAGNVVQQLAMFSGRLEAATKGNYLFVRPFQAPKYGVGVMDVAKGQVIKASPQSAIDIYEDVFVAERVTGELALYGMTESTPRVAVTLPRSLLGRLRASAVSNDLRYVAVSERSRGALWDLTKGDRIGQVPNGFRGAHFDSDQIFVADFTKFNNEGRWLVRVDPRQRQASGVIAVKEDLAEQHGAFLLVTTPIVKNDVREGATLDMRDAKTGKSLWTKSFPKGDPDVFVESSSSTSVFMWPVSAQTVRDEVRKEPALAKRLAALKEKQGDYFLQVVDARTGAARGALFLETGKGSFDVEDVFAVNDWVVIADSSNRVIVYSLSTGAPKGHVFGSRATVGAAAGLICVENGPGRVRLYDLATLQMREELTFAHAVSLSAFSPDGKRLLVLTADQTAYVLDVAGMSGH